MASLHNSLRYGELEEVAGIVDEHRLDEEEVRAVLLNLIDRLSRLDEALNSGDGTYRP